MTETGTIADTNLTQIYHASGPGTTTIKQLSFHNTGSSDCWVKVFWKSIQNRYVELAANEVTEVFAGLVMEPTDSIRAQAAVGGVITFHINTTRSQV